MEYMKKCVFWMIEWGRYMLWSSHILYPRGHIEITLHHLPAMDMFYSNVLLESVDILASLYAHPCETTFMSY